MCRMVGFISTEDKNVTPYFEILKTQALHGKDAPHGDGWGVACYNDGEFSIKKSSKPIWENGKIDEMAKSALLHARKASFGKASVLLSHPFVYDEKGKIWSFAHNGTIYNLSKTKKKGEIDTQFYAEMFIENLKDKDPLESVRTTVKTLIDISEDKYTSLNAIIVSDEMLMGWRYVKKVDDNYHTLFYEACKNSLSISTEPPGNEWIAIKNGEYLLAKKNELTIDFEVGNLF
jgi:predicted glutamine amidotransferase